MNEYLQEEQLGQELSSPRQVAVGIANVTLSEAQHRKMLYIRNTSTGGQVINVVFSNTEPATTTIGFQLNANEAIVDSDSEGYRCWTGKISAIGSAALGTIQIFERTKIGVQGGF